MENGNTLNLVNKSVMNEIQPASAVTSKTGYNRFLLLVAGLGGLLYGVDVGIISGALPYLKATFKDATTGQVLDSGQLSFIVAAVLLGGAFSTLFAGMLADLAGPEKMMIERPAVCPQRPDDCAGAQAIGRWSGTAASRHQRRT
jgi:hypothetical protein